VSRVETKAGATKPRKERRLWLKRLALSAGTVVVSLLLIEVVFRLVQVEPTRWVGPRHLESSDKRFGLDTYPALPEGAFDVDLRDDATRSLWSERGVPDVEGTARHRPHAVGFRYDEGLCRVDPRVGRTAPSIRVVMIGDSFTEGQGVPVEHTFSALLDRELGEAVEVVNCGRRGHDFPRIREFFEGQLAREPQIVVYAMTLNDAQQSEAFRARQAYLDDWIMDRRRMIRAGAEGGLPFWMPRLYALVRDRLESRRVGRETTRWYREMYAAPNRAGWEATRRHVRQMGEAMEARDGRLLVALLPLLIGLDGDYPFREPTRAIGEAFGSEELARRNVRFVDTTPAFLGRDAAELWVHPADRHPNIAAHRLIADALRPQLERLIAAQRGHEP
jgi:lysophospholipase L1-like esterase